MAVLLLRGVLLCFTFTFGLANKVDLPSSDAVNTLHITKGLGGVGNGAQPNLHAHQFKRREARTRRFSRRNLRLNDTSGSTGSSPDPYTTKIPISNDEGWNDMKMKGCNLLWGMFVDDSTAAYFVNQMDQGIAESSFKDWNEVASWGYGDVFYAVSDFREEDTRPEIDDALKNLGVDELNGNDLAGRTRLSALSHKQDVDKNGEHYQATGAAFWTVTNVQQGLLVAWHKFGPKYSGSLINPPVTKLPKLKNWADIAFLQWKHEAQETQQDPKNLKYIVSASIVNSDTYNLLGRALGLQDKVGHWVEFDDDLDCVPWEEKYTFSMTTDEGKVLLASPNGRGAALLLMQHKSTFGARATVDAVHVWCGLPDERLNFMFTVRQR